IRYRQYQYTTLGDAVGSPTDFALGPLGSIPVSGVSFQASNRRIAFCYSIIGDGNVNTAWYVEGLLTTNVSDDGIQYSPIGVEDNAYRAAYGLGIFQNGYLYAATPDATGEGHLVRWLCDGDVP